MRYYYTDALKAAWMAREFGFCFQSYHNDIFEGDQVFDWEICNAGHPYHSAVGYYDNLQDNNKIYIHPDCHEMLKPQEGDLGINSEYGFVRASCDSKFGFPWNTISSFKPCEDAEIIRRNGKAFFMPEA